MNSEYVEGNTPDPQAKYPCLMEAKNGEIILFRSAGRGIVVVSSAVSRHSFYSENWDMGSFTRCPPDASVTLSNGPA